MSTIFLMDVARLKRNRLQKQLAVQLARLARRQVLVAILLAAISLGIRAALLPWLPIPKPAIQDEFSYLLAADTYASGRLTNAKHPMWVHFETVHVLVQPTYQSKYPPVQGMILAVGQLLLHQPWFGVLLSMAALTAAIYWALAGWLPPKWALLGGVMALMHVGLLNYWSESYWGGAVAGAAGALVVGAVPRLRNKPSTSCAIIFAIGLALLANSRPYEGAVLGAISLVAVLWKVPLRFLPKPFALVLIPAALWMGYYNYRTTGLVLRMPYTEHERQYTVSSPFFWQTGLRPEPHYNHGSLRAAYVGWDAYRRSLARTHPRYRLGDLILAAHVILGSPLILCMGLFLVRMWRWQPKMRMAIAILALFVAGLELEVMLTPHYAAPGTALAYVVAIGGLRRLRYFSRPLQWAMLVAFVAICAWDYATPLSRWLYDKRDFVAQRDTVLKRLDQRPGKLLILVDYGPKHDVNLEWVYNRADIDASRIVWAREMGAERDQELIDYYPDRQVWKFFDNGDAGWTLTPLNPVESAKR